MTHQTEISTTLEKTVNHLINSGIEMLEYIPKSGIFLPSMEILEEIVDLLRTFLFPGYFGKTIMKPTMLSYSTGGNLERLFELLSEQIHSGLCFSQKQDSKEIFEKSERLTLEFIEAIPDIRRLLSTDVKAMYDADPAAKNLEEIIFLLSDYSGYD
jgi:serine O-acetyltransferase